MTARENIQTIQDHERADARAHRHEQQLQAEALLRFRAGAIDGATLERIPEYQLRAELVRAHCPYRIQAIAAVLQEHDELRAEAERADARRRRRPITLAGTPRPLPWTRAARERDAAIQAELEQRYPEPVR